jgi:large subunit ribosomal protein L15
MFKLDQLTRLVKKRKRVGRGGSRGGQSGKGGKGQTARSGGGPRPGFEGGQMPLYRRLPKRGFSNDRHRVTVEIINLETLNRAFQDGDIVTKEVLREKQIVKAKKGEAFLLKVLANGEFTKQLSVYADAFSAAAQSIIEQRGGKAELIAKGA